MRVRGGTGPARGSTSDVSPDGTGFIVTSIPYVFWTAVRRIRDAPCTRPVPAVGPRPPPEREACGQTRTGHGRERGGETPPVGEHAGHDRTDGEPHQVLNRGVDRNRGRAHARRDDVEDHRDGGADRGG